MPIGAPHWSSDVMRFCKQSTKKHMAGYHTQVTGWNLYICSLLPRKKIYLIYLRNLTILYIFQDMIDGEMAVEKRAELHQRPPAMMPHTVVVMLWQLPTAIFAAIIQPRRTCC